MMEDAAYSLIMIEPQLCKFFVAQLSLRSTVMDRVVEVQRDDLQLQKLIGKIDIALDEEGIIRFQHRVCVSDVAKVRKEVLDKTHKSKFFIHPRSNKMYQDLKRNFWWQSMKKDVAEFVTECLIYQQVKAKNKRPSGLIQRIKIPQ